MSASALSTVPASLPHPESHDPKRRRATRARVATAAAPPPELYPVFFDLADRPVLVVGGGRIALLKIEGLLRAGARVTAVAPAWRADFSPLENDARLTRVTRRFRPADLDDAWLAIAATDDPEVQRQIALTARERRVPLNAVDDLARSDFILPAIARRGALQIAVSTSGLAPRLAGRLRDWIEAKLPADFAEAVARIGAARGANKTPGDLETKRARFDAVVDAPALESALAGNRAPLEKKLAAWSAR